MPSGTRITAIICVTDEAASLRELLAAVAELRPLETIVVANDPADEPAAVAQTAGARVLRYRQRVGHDVGRALGAAATRGETLLFLDGDMALPAEDLYPFCASVGSGLDIALNRIDPYIQPSARLHPVNSAKRFLNAVLNRADLGCASLTAVPHALSRKALAALGPEVLAVPPLAHARAVLGRLRVEAVHSVNVVAPNPRRTGLNVGTGSPVEQLILGDTLEAIGWVLQYTSDARGGLTDLGRRRELLTPAAWPPGAPPCYQSRPESPS